MNFVMQCLVPPGDVNQLTINVGYGDVVESGLLFADPAVVDRETDELIEKAIAFKLAYRQQYQQKAGWNYEPSFC